MCSVMSSEFIGVVWAIKSPPIKAGDNRAIKSPPIKAGFFYAAGVSRAFLIRCKTASCLRTQAVKLSDSAAALSDNFLSRYAPTASVIAPEARFSTPPRRDAHCCKAFEKRL